MPPRSPSVGFFTFLVVVVVVAAGVGGGLLYLHNHPKVPSSPEVVRLGENVTVNYIGVFGSGPEQGKVFDTSIQSVAENNATYPKSLEYSPRNASGYTPLPVHVGPTPSAGYNVSGTTFGGVVTGFWKGLLGLAVNQSRSVNVSPTQGYGAINDSCLKTLPLTTKIASVLTMSPKLFSENYTGALAAQGATFTDPTFGWTDTVLSANASAIVVELGAAVGDTAHPYGWTMIVSNVSSGHITLTSELTPSSVGQVLGTLPNVTVCSESKFVLWSVDLASDSFVANYNSEVVGETLIFYVTIAAIVTVD